MAGAVLIYKKVYKILGFGYNIKKEDKDVML